MVTETNAALQESLPAATAARSSAEIPSLSGLRAIAFLAMVFTNLTNIPIPGKQASC